MNYVAPSQEAMNILSRDFGYDERSAKWFPISSPAMLVAALDAFVPEYHFWGLGLDSSEPLQTLIDAGFHVDEHVREALFFIVRHGNRIFVVRKIRTVSVRIIYTLPGGKPIRLKEYRIKDGLLVPRKHPSTSASETMRLWETDIEALTRLFFEELRKKVDVKHLASPFLTRMTEHQFGTVLMKEKFDPMVRVPGTNPSDKYPGVPTHNTISWYLWDMPKKYYKFSGYLEPNKSVRPKIHLWDNEEDYVINN